MGLGYFVEILPPGATGSGDSGQAQLLSKIRNDQQIEQIKINLTDMLEAIGRKTSAQVQAKVRSVMNVRTGRLANSITHAVGTDPETGYPILVIGSMADADGKPVVYARLREFGTAILPGGVLKPLHSKYLAFPFEASGYKNPLLTKAGAGGVQAKDFMANPSAYMNDVAGTIALPIEDAPVKILFARLGRTAKGRQKLRKYVDADGAPTSTKLVPLFVLAKSVKQHGSHYLYPTMAEALPAIAKGIELSISKGMKGQGWGT